MLKKLHTMKTHFFLQTLVVFTKEETSRPIETEIRFILIAEKMFFISKGFLRKIDFFE